MMDQTGFPQRFASALLPAATAALAAIIFIAEVRTSEKLTAALFYVLVVLLAARFYGPRGIMLVGLGCTGLMLLAFLVPGVTEPSVPGIKASIGAAVIGLTTFLALERKRAEKALRESEAQWQEVFEHNPVMYFMVDPIGTVLSVNGFGAAQLGYTAAELIGGTVLTVFLEEERELVKRNLTACAEELGRPRSWEIRKVRKDGRMLWVRENAKALPRRGKDPIVLIACEDITERRRSEQRMAAAYAVTRILAEADGIATAAPDLLQAIGENLAWDWGSIWSFNWERDSDLAPLQCDLLWRAPDLETVEFDTVSRGWVFANGEGLVGRVWRTATPIWMADAATEPGFLRAEAAARAGLHGAVIFPVLLGAKSMAVIEFFSRMPRDRDEEQLATLSAIGSQIGQFIQRRRAEAALRASEERWRLLFENSSAGMALFRLDGVCTAANRALQQMLGLSEGEIVGRNVLELNHPDERAATAEALTRYRDGSLTERNVEKKYLKNDGTPVWLNITNTLVPATETAPPFLQAVYVDVTGRVQAEAALRASEERWRAMVETAAVGITTLDLDLHHLTANTAFQRMTGYTEAELRSLTAHDITYEDDRRTTQQVIENATHPRHPTGLEKRIRRKDGQIIWIVVNGSLVPGTDSTPAFLTQIVVDVTARVQAEAALRASEERWRTVFETAAVGIVTLDLDLRYLTANTAFQRMTGYTEDELRHQTPHQIAHEDDRVTTQEVIDDVAAIPQHSRRRETRYRRKDGEIVWADVNSSLIAEADGTPAFLASIAVDITDRKRAEAGLRASEERWRAMFETSAVGIATSDLSLHYVTANRSFQRMTGYTEEELRNLTPVDITHEQDRTAMLERVDELGVGPGRGHRVEKRLCRKDGEIVWADVNTFFVPATDSTPAFIGGMAVDITDRKRAEAALRASEERWHAMVETAPVGIATLDFEDKRYLTANECFQRMTGYTEDELQQLTALAITHEADRAATQQRIDSGALGVLQRKRYRRKDGEIIWAEVTAFVVPATDSTPTFLGAVIVDITERKRAEEAFQQAQADLARLNRVMLLGEMTASIAHEINQPIAAVITNANAGLRWLGARHPDLEEVQGALGRIVRDGTRAGEVIGRIRALVRKRPPRRDLFEVDEVICEALSLTQAEMQRHGVKLQGPLADDLPVISADRVQLQQVMINLIVNAIEAMGTSEGPRELTIVAGGGEANDVFVEVRDTGPGLDPEKLDLLFQSFYTTKPDGIGMGLAISRSIAEAHGGQLSASPNKPRGAVFRLTLPIAPLVAQVLSRTGH